MVLPPDDNDDDKHGTAASAQVEQILEDELEKLSAPWEEELRTSKARQEDLLDQIAVSLCAFSFSTCPFLSCIYLDLTLNPIITCLPATQRSLHRFAPDRRRRRKKLARTGRGDPKIRARGGEIRRDAAKLARRAQVLCRLVETARGIARRGQGCELPVVPSLLCDRFARGSFPRPIARLKGCCRVR